MALRTVLCMVTLLALGCPAFAQAPPNDLPENAIDLGTIGSGQAPLQVSGTNTNATVQGPYVNDNDKGCLRGGVHNQTVFYRFKLAAGHYGGVKVVLRPKGSARLYVQLACTNWIDRYDGTGNYWSYDPNFPCPNTPGAVMTYRAGCFNWRPITACDPVNSGIMLVVGSLSTRPEDAGEFSFSLEIEPDRRPTYCDRCFNGDETVVDGPYTLNTTTTDAILGGVGGSVSVASVIGGNSPFTYSIDGSTYQTEGRFPNLPEGNYTVYVKDVNGCVAQKTVRIQVVIPPPVVAAAFSFCEGTPQLLRATGSMLEWFQDSLLTRRVGEGSPFAATLAVGKHRYFVTQTVNGQRSRTAPVEITILTRPLVVFAPLVAQCLGNGPVVLVGSPTGGVFSGPGVAGGQFRPDVAGLGTHPLTYAVSGTNGCRDSLRQTVAVYPLPLVRLDSLPAVCGGSAPLPLGGSPPGGTYEGLGVSGTTFSPVVAGPGQHVITYRVVDANGCRGQASQQLKVSTPPVVDAGPDTTILQGSSFLLNATGNAENYAWQPPDGLSNPLVLTPSAHPLQTTAYLVRAERGGCFAQDSLTIRVVPRLWIPDVFTPNGDGINEDWVIQNTDQYPACRLRVFNRWGEVVFASTGYPQPWDGRLDGMPLQGTFTYRLETELHVYRGTVRVIR